jgi:hypothetical protein
MTDTSLWSNYLISYNYIFQISLLVLLITIALWGILITYGDGLNQANMALSQDKNSEASLYFGISPLLLKSANTNKYTIEFQLYNTADGTRYSNATYHISIVKSNYSLGKDQKVVDGTFITRNGFLTININNSDDRGPANTVTHSHIHHTNYNDNVNLTIPFRLESGQYRIHSLVDVLHERPLFFDTVWQEGEIKSKNFTFQDHGYNITAISYYDKVKNLLFNPFNKTFSWEMPFEYNRTRVDDGGVRVHEELIIPKILIRTLNSSSFDMTMNDQHFDEALFSIDPYTLKDKTIVHYVPKVNALFEISNSNGTLEANKIVQFNLALK